MKRFYSLRRICVAVMSLLLLFAFAATAYAADSAVDYNGRYASSVFGFVPTDTDLFRNFKGLMPGDTVTQNVTIKNRSGDDIRVYLFGKPESESVDHLLDVVKITVKDGGTTIVSDSARASWPSNNTYYNLGMLDPGETKTLVVTIELPITMGNEYQNAVGKVEWGFQVNQYDDDDDHHHHDPDIPLGPPEIIIDDGEQIPLSPGTGDNTNLYVWAGGFVVLSLGLAVLIAKKRKVS